MNQGTLTGSNSHVKHSWVKNQNPRNFWFKALHLTLLQMITEINHHFLCRCWSSRRWNKELRKNLHLGKIHLSEHYLVTYWTSICWTLINYVCEKYAETTKLQRSNKLSLKVGLRHLIAQVCICEPITGNVSSKEKEENQDTEKLKKYLFIVFFLAVWYS